VKSFVTIGGGNNEISVSLHQKPDEIADRGVIIGNKDDRLGNAQGLNIQQINRLASPVVFSGKWFWLQIVLPQGSFRVYPQSVLRMPWMHKARL
jgi:hypothetical protein